MRKFIYRVDLTRLYERYNYLITVEGRNQFVRTVFTLFLCAVATIFIWYSGIISLGFQKSNEVSLIDQLQSEKLQFQSATDENLSDIQPIKSSGLETFLEQATEKESVEKESVEKALMESVEKALMESVEISIEAPLVSEGFAAKKTIYKGANTTQVALTFDDGYNQKTVEKVLDVLKSNNIKSTFFIIGKVLDDYPEVWKRAIDEGHEICNHTNNHQVLTNMSDRLVQAEIQDWETSAKKVLGVDYFNRMKKEFPYLRLPGGGGAKSDRILAIAQNNGYTVVGWNLETFSSVINPLRETHSVQDISNKIEQHVVKRCSNGSIILLHFNKYDIGNIEKIIQGIKNRGFDIQPLSQIIK